MKYNKQSTLRHKYIAGFIISGVMVCTFYGCNISGCIPFTKHADNTEYLIKVGDESLTVTDFDQMFELTKSGYSDDIINDEEELKFFQLRLLISLSNELLLISEAKRLGVEVSDDELDTAVDNIKKDYPPDVLEKMFIENGISFSVWKQRLKKRLIIEKLIDANLSNDIAVLSDDIKKYHDQAYADQDSLSYDERKSIKDNNFSNSNEDDKKIIKYLRSKKAEKLYSEWFEKIKKPYKIEINEKQWKKVFG